MVNEFIKRCKEITALVSPQLEEVWKFILDGEDVFCIGEFRGREDEATFPNSYFYLSDEEIIQAEAKRQKREADFYAAWIETTKRQKREADEKEFNRLKEKLGL